MQINKAQFVCSSERLSQLPKDSLPEFAFIGRSNVGKSSLVNMLTGRSGLAKVSGTPGKTRLINHFRINDSWYLVDLPGYGYARTSKTQRDEFAKIITDYVLRCERMHFLFVLVDSRLEPQKIDLRFIEMLGREGIPFGIVAAPGISVDHRMPPFAFQLFYNARITLSKRRPLSRPRSQEDRQERGR